MQDLTLFSSMQDLTLFSSSVFFVFFAKQNGFSSSWIFQNVPDEQT
jgi:hypothetical protein